jgi:hypothetical protein
MLRQHNDAPATAISTLPGTFRASAQSHDGQGRGGIEVREHQFPLQLYSSKPRAPARSACNEYFMSDSRPDEFEEPDSRRGALIGMGLVLLLIVGGLVLARVLRHTAQLQDCVMSGRTNCAPVETTSSSDNHGSN